MTFIYLLVARKNYCILNVKVSFIFNNQTDAIYCTQTQRCHIPVKFPRTSEIHFSYLFVYDNFFQGHFKTWLLLELGQTWVKISILKAYVCLDN